MRCPECKAKVPDHLSLCPECGEMVQDTRPMRAQRAREVTETQPVRARRAREVAETRPVRAPRPEPAVSAPEEPVPAPRVSPAIWRVLKVLLFVIIALITLSLSIGLGGYYGLHQGELDRAQFQAEEANQHYQAGLQRLTSGEYELAIAEFELVLKIDPNHPYAQQGIVQAQAGIDARPTPTVEVYEIVAADVYQQAFAHYQAEKWEEAAAAFIQVRALDPDYRAEEVEEMLFYSLYNAGMALLDEDRLEEGIFYLDQAVALRPLDENAQTQRHLAVRYMTALGYWGVNWDRCIERFEQLHAIAPNYKDVFRRLYGAHLAYGDAWYTQDEMCPAEEQYTLALQLINDPEVEQKRAEAEQVCLVATPTPIVSLGGTQVITLTELPPGFTTGRLAYPVYDTQTYLYDVYVLSTDRRVVRVAAGADQPCWMRSTGALGYRDLLSPGISLLAAEGATSQSLVAGGGLAWPTFSPDGQRIAYAKQDSAGTWQIYIAPMDGSTEPQVHAPGKGPVWGSNGWLAWSGCDGSGACGIFVDHPDDDQPPIRLSSSTNDIALNWHPDGGSLAYMANHTGDWEIYLVSTGGGFAQLTDDPASDGLPVWAPDGSGLAFVSNRDGAWGLYLMGPNGEDPHKILALGPNMPEWTSQRLAWGP